MADPPLTTQIGSAFVGLRVQPGQTGTSPVTASPRHRTRIRPNSAVETARLMLQALDLEHRVNSAKGIWRHRRGFWIIPPLAIREKAVLVDAGSEDQVCNP